VTPLCTFLCTTYGRAALEKHLIEEMLYWYTQQTIRSRCELLIANDAPEQTVCCNVPGVRVINFPSRFPTYGDKLNAALEQARGEIILPSDDDDISLPWRAEQAVWALSDGSDFFCPGKWWYALADQRPLADGKGFGWNCSAYLRNKFLGRYPRMNAGEDGVVKTWAYKNLRKSPCLLSNAGMSYVYRWGVSRQHFSGNTSNLEKVYQDMKCGPPGCYEVSPKAGRDWAFETMRESLTQPEIEDILPDQKCWATVQGWFDFQNIYDSVVHRLPKTGGKVVEVGCWKGCSLCYLLGKVGMSGKVVTVVGVDAFQGSIGETPLQWEASQNDIEAECRRNCSRVGVPFTLIRSDSAEAASRFEDKSLDFVFIDACHEEDFVVRDIRAWLPKVKPGGLLAGHDINWPGVRRAVTKELPAFIQNGGSWTFPIGEE
jgi:hypothetical protein